MYHRVRTLGLMILASVWTAGCCECDDRTGRTYKVEFDEIEGDCGRIDDFIFTEGESGGDSDCDIDVDVSDDNCTVTISQTCFYSDGSKFLGDGEVDWDCDGAAADGEFTFTVLRPSGSVECESTYETTYTER